MQFAWRCPDDAVAALVFAHGAGGSMAHPTIEAIAAALAARGIATLRFNFPYVDAGRRRPDPQPVATAAIAEAAAEAAARTGLPLWLGGHSFGGRMASHAVLDREVAARGLIFCAFPLHPAGRPGAERAAHLAAVRLPMLFVSGTRDALAERERLAAVVAALPDAELRWLDGADHGYRRRARAGGERGDVFDEIARAARAFIDRHAA